MPATGGPQEYSATDDNSDCFNSSPVPRTHMSKAHARQLKEVRYQYFSLVGYSLTIHQATPARKPLYSEVLKATPPGIHNKSTHVSSHWTVPHFILRPHLNQVFSPIPAPSRARTRNECFGSSSTICTTASIDSSWTSEGGNWPNISTHQTTASDATVVLLRTLSQIEGNFKTVIPHIDST